MEQLEAPVRQQWKGAYLVDEVAVREGVTRLVGRADGTTRAVDLPAVPATGRAAAWKGSMRRLAHVEVSVDAAASRVACSIVGRSGRRLASVPVPLSIGLELAVDGVPVLVRVD
ncbi:MAG: hypothetical protein AAFZ07_09460 [Actinomycetota bacterium]